ncbi:putative alpha/Beta hydrolase [Rosa chinensis]|uniref:Putative alpha/Beta hydrolase n=1 Tax=Rosa chinensis TaxID=74649 RepID=A0A2P6PMA5_ROSCH|nr:putative alpha/Beta hydrolase [Rosa chinensis]
MQIFTGFWWFRAHGLFYYLKGGQVDYGEERSIAYRHSQVWFSFSSCFNVLLFDKRARNEIAFIIDLIS